VTGLGAHRVVDVRNERLDDQGLRVTVAATYPLRDGATAYATRSSHGRGPGKTVLTV
jgi:NADPH:quinone reductase-like Zn-dependent oxidoreductase